MTSGKERLILAGINEIQKNGVQELSLRQVAADCGLSTGAPYKHFKNKQDFILAIIKYINQQWYDRQDVVRKKYQGDVRRQLTEISLEYIRFLLENPQFRSIIMLRDENMSPDQVRMKAALSNCTKQLIHEYCLSVQMPREVEIRKTFVVRSFIYGAALMVDNGELENNQQNFDAFAMVIDREFDLP